MDQTEFTQVITSKVEGELLIPFEDLDLNLEPFTAPSTERTKTITDVQYKLVEWCKVVPGCNWSVGFIDDEDQHDIVVKWWFGAAGNPI